MTVAATGFAQISTRILGKCHCRNKGKLSGEKYPVSLDQVSAVEDGSIFVSHSANCEEHRKLNHQAVKDGGIKQKMSHTYTNLLTHIVFSTKDRLPLISNQIKPELLAFLGGLTKELKGKPLINNGMSDHVHLLASLPPTVSIAESMRFIKANSSKWISQKFGEPFEWQKGYGAFSVSRSNVDAVYKYIQNQEAHHQKLDFREEFIALLKKNEADFDEQFLWK